MKLTYRDKKILLVFCILIILVLGIILGVRPMANSIKANKVERTAQQAVQQDIQDKIAQIPTYDKSIENAYKEATKIANNFSEQKNAYQLDQFIQEYINNNHISLLSAFQTTEPIVQTLDYYVDTPNIITYPIFEAADINGTVAEDISKKLEQSNYISARTTESVLCSTIGFDFKAKKDDITKFIEDINSIGSTIQVTGLSIKDYTFGENAEDTTMKGYSEGNIIISVYSAQAIEKPNLDK